MPGEKGGFQRRRSWYFERCGFNGFFNYANEMSPLGNAPAEDCANYVLSLFSDYTRFVTMQNLFHDGGFSNTGVSQVVMDKFED